MSFWKTMPVVVQETQQPNTFTQIVDEQYLLNKINQELKTPHVKFEYKIYENSDLNKEFILTMKKFFDEQYSQNQDIHLLFEKDIYEFFTLNALVTIFYSPDTKETMGYIVGKKIKLNIDSKSIDTLEVSFFCIHQKFRNKHLGPYFINVILKEFIVRYNISISTYALSDNIRSPYYTIKNNIHRPINIKHLKKCNFLPDEFDFEEYQHFDTNKDVDLVYLNNTEIPDTLLNLLYKKLNTFQSTYFTVFKELSKKEIKKIFKNKSFHNFIVFNKDKTIKDFISLYKLKLNLTTLNLEYTTSSIYTMFFQNYNVSNIRSTLELISEHCYKNNTLDVLSFFDIFPVKNYNDIKCLYGQGSLHYYIFNYNMIPIPNHKISYVTI
jgi:hypothetical protein